MEHGSLRERASHDEQENEPTIALDEQGRSFGDFAAAAEGAVRSGDHATAQAIRKEQVRFLHDRYAKSHPDFPQVETEYRGFYFFEVDSKNAEQGAVVNHKTLEAIVAFEQHPDSDAWLRIIEANKEAILSEYRINLRPQKDYVPEAIDRLLGLFEQRPELKALASSFKVKVGPSAPDPSRPENAFAEIILYVKNDPARGKDGKTASQKSLETLLPEVAEALQDLVPYADTSPMKRSSLSVNDLISIAQSGGDLKGLLSRVDKARGTHYLDEYFDKDTNYAFAKGEQPPDIEPNDAP